MIASYARLLSSHGEFYLLEFGPFWLAKTKKTQKITNTNYAQYNTILNTNTQHFFKFNNRYSKVQARFLRQERKIPKDFLYYIHENTKISYNLNSYKYSLKCYSLERK